MRGRGCKALLVGLLAFACSATATLAQNAPTPLLDRGHPVNWWFVFKLNASVFPKCKGGVERACIFGGEPQNYRGGYGQQFVYASNLAPRLQEGGNVCVGDSLEDPVGATFAEIYNGSYFYFVWNDQFYQDPKIKGCGNSCGGPWGHSKGIVAWNESGNGIALQVTTPSWAGAAHKDHPRHKDGNTLGCVHDKDVKVSQHFFALRLDKDGVLKVLRALRDASVVSDPNNRQLVHNGGPQEIQDLVKTIGKRCNNEETKCKDDTYRIESLSDDVQLITKPSSLNVPPWQLVSAVLDGASLRVATWWARPQIYSSTESTRIKCWPVGLRRPGAVQIATNGVWNGQKFGLAGGPGPNFNHAKIGVTTSGPRRYTIFGDLNQQGSLSGTCDSSQNGRGGLFFVVSNDRLFESVTSLINGSSAPTRASHK